MNKDHHYWLLNEEKRLIAWARRARTATAFGYLDENGRVQISAGNSLLITARMTYVFAVAALRGDADAYDDAAHGIAALAPDSGAFWDKRFTGWISVLPFDQPESSATGMSEPAEAGVKSAYDHSFVLLSTAAAKIAGVAGASEAFEAASAVVLERLWNEDDGALIDSYSADWSAAENYRGANANMHFVEACLVAHAATGDSSWLDRALRVADRFINRYARSRQWRLLEHYDADWNPLPAYNSDNPADQFRPFGYLVGHSCEWARLLIQLSHALRAAKRVEETWLVEAARNLWEVALRFGWAADGKPGFLYSLDWDDVPIVTQRLHWVIAEAIGAAWALYLETNDETMLDWYHTLWAQVQENFVDERGGSWHHELDPEGMPDAQVWSGKPDIYHALGAVMLPLVPMTSTIVNGAKLTAL